MKYNFPSMTINKIQTSSNFNKIPNYPVTVSFVRSLYFGDNLFVLGLIHEIQNSLIRGPREPPSKSFP